MNTKQILYDALTSQLQSKRLEAKQYDETIYEPSIIELRNHITTYFSQFFNDLNIVKPTINFNGSTIQINCGKGYSDEINISIKNKHYGDEKLWKASISWSGGIIDNINSERFEYLKILTKLANNLPTIEELYLKEWYPNNLKIENAKDLAWDEYHSFNNALTTLNNEIKQDTINEMKQNGYEIKKFKDQVSLNWDYDNSNERNYKITTQPKFIEIQSGRSQYDTTYISGFKVLGKKGNKYNVEVYKEAQISRKFDVLEKKFEKFINNVSEWETEADKRAEKVNNDFNERTKNC